jgi:squalene-hopene/tetraprenyl-beta-curcumene cyclase
MTLVEYNRELTERLLTARSEQGIWRGGLSSSALSTAVGTFALALAGGPGDSAHVAAGLDWLAGHANADGGWGDTPKSASNLSTTLLAWSALRARDGGGNDVRTAAADAEQWLASRVGDTGDPSAIARAVLDHYGSDRTFSVPILTMCALAGRLGGDNAWDFIPQLPFELAVLPRGLFRFAGLPVVSYALPALIAMGLVRHRRAGRWRDSAGLGALRDCVTARVLARLCDTQPENGGFLEATPLTGFVAMSLAGAGLRDHPVVDKALGFLRSGQRQDGSWPIDTDLATWLTVMTVRSVGADLAENDRRRVTEWLLNQQFSSVHPFTGAAPGGWGWTDLPGSVPDADDTSGVLVALHGLMGERRDDALVPVRRGLQWLLSLQNRDGGLPTFCRGWGTLPFDRSCPDITAHALRTDLIAPPNAH